MKKEQEKRDNNVIPFVPLALAGKEPPEGTGKNWVSRMKQGTRFLAKSKQDFGSILGDYVILVDTKTMPGVVLLGENVTHKDMVIKWHDPEKFSNDHTFYLTLEVLEPNDGNSNKIPARPVASDAQPEVIDSVHDKE